MLSDFPAKARRAAGRELWQAQCGLMPSNFKPMLNFGPGDYEIRVKASGQWRVIYVARFENSVYVQHAFGKKSQKTRTEDIELARWCYQQIKGQA